MLGNWIGLGVVPFVIVAIPLLLIAVTVVLLPILLRRRARRLGYGSTVN